MSNAGRRKIISKIAESFCALAVVLAFAFATPVLAHAILLVNVPADGAVLARDRWLDQLHRVGAAAADAERRAPAHPLEPS